MKTSLDNTPLGEDAALHEQKPSAVGDGDAGTPIGVVSDFNQVPGTQGAGNTFPKFISPIESLTDFMGVYLLASSKNHGLQELDLRVCELRVFLSALTTHMSQFALKHPDLRAEMALFSRVVSDLSLVAREMTKDAAAAAKAHYDLTKELGSAYKRFPELLPETDKDAEYRGRQNGHGNIFDDVDEAHFAHGVKESIPHAADSTTAE